LRGIIKLLWLLPALLLVPVVLWMNGEFGSAVAEITLSGNRTQAVLIEESNEPGCLFNWTQSEAVSRGRFTRQVDRKLREPIDQVCKLTSDENKVFYFSDLKEQVGKQIYHLWEYQGKEMAKVALGEVKGPRWRVWSSKNLISGWSGIWTVKVVTKEGVVLHQDQFEYIQQ
jgi:hypothetical protein